MYEMDTNCNVNTRQNAQLSKHWTEDYNCHSGIFHSSEWLLRKLRNGGPCVKVKRSDTCASSTLIRLPYTDHLVDNRRIGVGKVSRLTLITDEIIQLEITLRRGRLKDERGGTPYR